LRQFLIEPSSTLRYGSAAVEVATSALTLILTPDLRIVDASVAYARATMVRREEIRGRHLFEVFPDNPSCSGADGVRNLRASLTRALAEGRPDPMPVQRYDIRDRISDDDEWIERYWLPLNSPVHASGSQEVTHLLHSVQDLTQAVVLARYLREQSLVMREMHRSLHKMQTEWRRRQHQLQHARLELKSMMQAGSAAPNALERVRAGVDAPSTQKHFFAGDRAPIRGIYRVAHPRYCELNPPRIFVREGEVFRPCLRCATEVIYWLLAPIVD
jgi:hypothetical protein